MTQVELFALDPATGAHERYPLPLEPGGQACTVQLRCLPGAEALHLALAIDGQIRQRVEITVAGGEDVELQISLDAALETHVASASWHVLTLPPDERFAPATAFRPSPLEHGLDLALVIDGTLRSFEIGNPQSGAMLTSKPLFATPEKRDQLVEQILSFVDALGAEDLRAAVVAFGDAPLADATTADLRPIYHLYPPRAEDRALRPTTTEDLLDALTRIPPTPGADFVDALADALAACAELHWRPTARKLVLVVGDSPGHSLIQPAPWGCDARARERDVDIEALRLHAHGIEIATLYCPPPREGVYDYFEPHLREIFDHARKHYQRLASLPDLAFDLSSFDPQDAADRLTQPCGWIARGAAYGELLEARTAESAPRPKAKPKRRRSPAKKATKPKPETMEIAADSPKPVETQESGPEINGPKISDPEIPWGE